MGDPDLKDKLKHGKSPYKTKVLVYLKWTFIKLNNGIIENALLLAA